MSEESPFAEFPELGNQGLLFGKQTRCIECGRPLSVEASQERGMGPVCAKKARDDAHELSAADEEGHSNVIALDGTGRGAL